MISLTPSQRRMLWCILLAEHEGRRLTFRDLGERLKMRSLNGIYDQLCRLRRIGLVTWEHNQKRTLRPLVRVEFFG